MHLYFLRLESLCFSLTSLVLSLPITPILQFLSLKELNNLLFFFSLSLFFKYSLAWHSYITPIPHLDSGNKLLSTPHLVPLQYTPNAQTCYCSVVQSCLTLLSPWAAGPQASLSITNSRSLLKLMSIESVKPSNHLVLCRPLLILCTYSFHLVSLLINHWLSPRDGSKLLHVVSKYLFLNSQFYLPVCPKLQWYWTTFRSWNRLFHSMASKCRFLWLECFFHRFPHIHPTCLKFLQVSLAKWFTQQNLVAFP